MTEITFISVSKRNSFVYYVKSYFSVNILMTPLRFSHLNKNNTLVILFTVDMVEEHTRMEESTNSQKLAEKLIFITNTSEHLVGFVVSHNLYVLLL